MRLNDQWAAIGNPGALATGSQRFLAVIFVTSIAMFLFALFMVFSGEGMFLLHGPLLLLSTLLVFLSGISYLVNPSRAAGLFLVGLLYFSFDATFREGLVAGGGADLQSVVKGLFSLCLLIYGIFTGAKHLLVRPVVVLFFMYAAYGLLSSYYSSAVILGIGSGVALVAIAFMAADYATREHEDLFRLWRTLYIASVVMAVGSLVVLAISPLQAQDMTMAGSFRLRGLTGSANSLGPVMAIGLISGMLVWKHQSQREWRWIHGLACAMLGVLLLLTNSRTSIIAFLVSVTSVWVVMTYGSMGVLLTAFLAACFGFMMLYPSVMNAIMTTAAELFSRGGGVSELSSLTGRDEIWKACVRLIHDSPWIGYGLGSVRIEIPRTWEDMWGNSAATAHNGVLESMISVGLVGTVPLFLAFFYCLYIFVRYFSGRQAVVGDQGRDRALTICGMQCLGFLLVHSFAEKSFTGTAAPATMAFGICVATAAYLERVRWNKKPLLLKTQRFAEG
ncbi:O-antigen ligase [Aquabacterium sp. CECT 9606]|uniref:O-antigen ligase family protein n=1 Tax=Aquabacterium sp. CECT 9606 TaxID=2845822 RepID=UPI001E33573C|nr:O-antigen ligase family protein [Aquabacterium sp. CECT 9606]CAH0351859.1 hypothetical protein AQB9606_02480 [Aquabacterium sp. CECT 9606]